MKHASVLIIDDNQLDRYILSRLLKKTGHEGRVFEANDGQDALDFLKDYQARKEEYSDDFPPAVIFLDINMPKIDGFEFLEKFSALKKDNPEYESIVFMMFTSSDLVEEKEKAFSYHFVKDFLLKGDLDIELLKQKLDDFLCN